jgi:hypothetical protein
MIDQQGDRVPVVAGDSGLAGPRDVVQPAWPGSATHHVIGCTCCFARTPLAQALAKLFFARARGEIPFFSRVIVPCAPTDEPALADALVADPLTAARFRYAGRLVAETGSVSSPSPSASSM